MAVIHVTEDNFKETVQEGIVLLDFWAARCVSQAAAEGGL